MIYIFLVWKAALPDSQGISLHYSLSQSIPFPSLTCSMCWEGGLSLEGLGREILFSQPSFPQLNLDPTYFS